MLIHRNTVVYFGNNAFPHIMGIEYFYQGLLTKFQHTVTTVWCTGALHRSGFNPRDSTADIINNACTEYFTKHIYIYDTCWKHEGSIEREPLHVRWDVSLQPFFRILTRHWVRTMFIIFSSSLMNYEKKPIKAIKVLYI